MEWKTTTQILENLKHSNDTTDWSYFQDYFYPVIFRFAQKMGLSCADAEDAAQETLINFLKSLRQDQYFRSEGRLSHWVMGIAHNVIRNHYRKQPKIHSDSICSTPQDLEDEDAVRHTWQTEWRKVILQRCLTQARKEFDSKSFLAFEQYALEGKSIEQVCRNLDLSSNAVYIAKSRILTRLRRLYSDLDEK